jgi:hypothetical protein
LKFFIIEINEISDSYVCNNSRKGHINRVFQVKKDSLGTLVCGEIIAIIRVGFDAYNTNRGRL